jgi:hypothetical protein
MNAFSRSSRVCATCEVIPDFWITLIATRCPATLCRASQTDANAPEPMFRSKTKELISNPGPTCDIKGDGGWSPMSELLWQYLLMSTEFLRYNG